MAKAKKRSKQKSDKTKRGKGGVKKSDDVITRAQHTSRLSGKDHVNIVGARGGKNDLKRDRVPAYAANKIGAAATQTVDSSVPNLLSAFKRDMEAMAQKSAKDREVTQAKVDYIEGHAQQHVKNFNEIRDMTINNIKAEANAFKSTVDERNAAVTDAFNAFARELADERDSHIQDMKEKHTEIQETLLKFQSNKHTIVEDVMNDFKERFDMFLQNKDMLANEKLVQAETAVESIKQESTNAISNLVKSFQEHTGGRDENAMDYDLQGVDNTDTLRNPFTAKHMDTIKEAVARAEEAIRDNNKTGARPSQGDVSTRSDHQMHPTIASTVDEMAKSGAINSVPVKNEMAPEDADMQTLNEANAETGMTLDNIPENVNEDIGASTSNPFKFDGEIRDLPKLGELTKMKFTAQPPTNMSMENANVEGKKNSHSKTGKDSRGWTPATFIRIPTKYQKIDEDIELTHTKGSERYIMEGVEF